MAYPPPPKKKKNSAQTSCVCWCFTSRRSIKLQQKSFASLPVFSAHTARLIEKSFSILFCQKPYAVWSVPSTYTVCCLVRNKTPERIKSNSHRHLRWCSQLSRVSAVRSTAASKPWCLPGTRWALRQCLGQSPPHIYSAGRDGEAKEEIKKKR